MSHPKIGKVLVYYWKLKAIESIEMSSPAASLTKEQLTQLISILIDNHFVKDFLIKESLLYTLKDYQRHQHEHIEEESLHLNKDVD